MPEHILECRLRVPILVRVNDIPATAVENRINTISELLIILRAFRGTHQDRLDAEGEKYQTCLVAFLWK